MSEIGVLSQQPQTTSDLAHRLDSGILAIKKLRLGLANKPEENPEVLAGWMHEIASAVEALVLQLPAPDHGSASPRRTQEPLEVPSPVAAQLAESHRGDLEYYRADLQELRDHLVQGLTCLTDEDIHLLDDFAAATGVYASAVFRRLMRK